MHFKEFFIWCIERNNYVLKRTLFIASFFLFCALQSGEKKVKLEQVPRGAQIPPAGAII